MNFILCENSMCDQCQHLGSAKNEVILWLIILAILDNIRLYKEPFAIGVFTEIQLYSNFTVSLEHPIQIIPQLWNQSF